MDKRSALALFHAIEGLRIETSDIDTDEESETRGQEYRWGECPFNVRLDAGSAEGFDPDQAPVPDLEPYVKRKRTWRIFVTWSGTNVATDELNGDWGEVMKLATEHGGIVQPENGGLAIV